MSILPITAGGAVVGMGTTAGVLIALGVTKGAAVNFALASGLLLTSAALAAGALGLGGSLLLTLRARRPGAFLRRDWNGARCRDVRRGGPALRAASPDSDCPPLERDSIRRVVLAPMGLGAVERGGEVPAPESLSGVERVAVAGQMGLGRGGSQGGLEEAGPRLADADGHVAELTRLLGDIPLPARLGGLCVGVAATCHATSSSSSSS